MTEIKTADVWTKITNFGELHHRSNGNKKRIDKSFDRWVTVPAVLVHGLTEAEVHEAAALLEKSKEVCEWRRVDECTFSQSCQSLVDYECEDVPRLCPSCGRKVVAK